MKETGHCTHTGTKRQARGRGELPATLPIGAAKEYDEAFKRMRERGLLPASSWRRPFRRPGS